MLTRVNAKIPIIVAALTSCLIQTV